MSQKLLAILILTCAAGSATAAVTVTFRQDVNGYTGTEDTQLTSGDAFFPAGEITPISIDEDGDLGGPTQGLLRFTNILQSQGGPIPAGSTVGYAELEIFVVDPGASNSNVSFHRVLAGSPWDEANSTWESEGGGLFPDETGFVAKPILYDGVEALSTPDFVLPDASGDEIALTFNATAAVQTWVSGAANFGWAISQATSSGWDFSSSEEFEETERPKLTVVYYQPGKLADINGDNNVNLTDYQLLLNNMGIHVTQTLVPGEAGDLNFDRKVDPADFGIFKTQFPGGVAAFEAALAAVPEPSSAVLVVLSACGLALRRRRMRRLSAQGSSSLSLSQAS
jgi:hypothetical protein